MKNIITVDLGYGDSGKGTITDYLVHEHISEWTVRFSGGAQCAHNVHLKGGKHFTFHQLGSGSFNSFNKTFLSEDVIINPCAMLLEKGSFEYKKYGDMSDRLYVSNDCILTTLYHKIANRAILHANGKHNSCGMGIWETVSNDIKITPRDTFDEITDKLLSLRKAYEDNLEELDEYKKTSIYAECWDDDVLVTSQIIQNWKDKVTLVDNYIALGLLKESKTPIIYENAQGVLIDDVHGLDEDEFNTPTRVTAHNALKITNQLGTETEVMGITRSFSTRHGDGHFDAIDDVSLIEDDDNYNLDNYQGELRVGNLDIKKLRYAYDVIAEETKDKDIKFNLAVTHLDKLKDYSPDDETLIDFYDYCNPHRFITSEGKYRCDKEG